MFKVSFKENPQFPVKNIQRFNDGKVTVVTLKGKVQMPLFLQYFIPPAIFKWVDTLKYVDVEFTMSKMFIKVTGKSICSKEDTVDKVLGERIAEARAKIHLYEFMSKFCWVLLMYFQKELFGKDVSTSLKEDSNNTVLKSIHKYQKLYINEHKHLNILLGHESNTESSQEH